MLTRFARRGFKSTSTLQAKVLAACFPDPLSGYPPPRVRAALPDIRYGYPDGSSLPTPSALDFAPGDLVGCVSGELGLRGFLEAAGHSLVVTDDTDGVGCLFDCELHDADFIVTPPNSTYLDRRRLMLARHCKAVITAGVGSDHVDLEAAMELGVDVAEVAYSSSTSVAEHTVLTILALVRNFVFAHSVSSDGGWRVADVAARAFDLEGMHVGTVATGRVGLALMSRLKPFGVRLHYADRHRLPAATEAELGATYWPSWEEMAPHLDVLTLNCPLQPETEQMVNAQTIRLLRRGAYIVNCARGKLCDADAIADALEDGHLAGYGGDAWFPQPPDRDHRWRTMPHNAMVPNYADQTLAAQARYAAGVREMLEDLLVGRSIRECYQIVTKGKMMVKADPDI